MTRLGMTGSLTTGAICTAMTSTTPECSTTYGTGATRPSDTAAGQRRRSLAVFHPLEGPCVEMVSKCVTSSVAHSARWLPEQFKHSTYKWWRSQLSRYLIRPKDWVLNYIGEKMLEIK